MATYGKVFHLLNDEWLNLQDVEGNVEPYPELRDYDEYQHNITVYRMNHSVHELLGFFQDLTRHLSAIHGKEYWSWMVQWEKSGSKQGPREPVPKKIRVGDRERPPPELLASTSSERRCLSRELFQEDDVLRILIDIVQVDTMWVPNYIEFLYQWIDYYEGGGKALQAALRMEIPSLWQFDTNPRALHMQNKTNKGKDSKTDLEVLAQEIGEKILGAKSESTESDPVLDLDEMERRTEQSERLQYREVKFGLQPPIEPKDQPLPPLLNFPTDRNARKRFYTSCYKSRQCAFWLLQEAGVSAEQVANYKRLQPMGPKETSDAPGGPGLLNYYQEESIALELIRDYEAIKQIRAKEREVAMSKQLAEEARRAAALQGGGSNSSRPERLPGQGSNASRPGQLRAFPPTSRRPDAFERLIQEMEEKTKQNEHQKRFLIKKVPPPLQGKMKSKMFEGAFITRPLTEEERKERNLLPDRSVPPSYRDVVPSAEELAYAEDMERRGFGTLNYQGGGDIDIEGDTGSEEPYSDPDDIDPDERDDDSDDDNAVDLAIARLTQAPNVPMPTLQGGSSTVNIPAYASALDPNQGNDFAPLVHSAIMAAIQNQDTQTAQSSVSPQGITQHPQPSINPQDTTQQPPTGFNPRDLTQHAPLGFRPFPSRPPPGFHSYRPGPAPQVVPMPPRASLFGTPGAGPAGMSTSSLPSRPCRSVPQRTVPARPALPRSPKMRLNLAASLTRSIAAPQPPPPSSAQQQISNPPAVGQQPAQPAQMLLQSQTRAPAPLNLQVPSLSSFASPLGNAHQSPQTMTSLAAGISQSLNLVTPRTVALSSRAPAENIPIVVYLPYVLNSRRKHSVSATDDTEHGDAFLIGYASTEDLSFTFDRVVFTSINLSKYVRKRVERNHWSVVENYYHQPNPTAKDAHTIAYARMTLPYVLMLKNGPTREDTLTKRWRVTPGIMRASDRGAVWEGYGLWVTRELGMTLKERQGRGVWTYTVDKKIGFKTTKTMTKEEAEYERMRDMEIAQMIAEDEAEDDDEFEYEYGDLHMDTT